jgi:hypothetical protein
MLILRECEVEIEQRGSADAPRSTPTGLKTAPQRLESMMVGDARAHLVAADRQGGHGEHRPGQRLAVAIPGVRGPVG